MEIIRKAVIPVAGLGTRLLSATKEQPKEMLPVFACAKDGTLSLKPMVQQIFEHLFDFGIREFYFIVGRGKRAIEDHFTPDSDIVQRLRIRRLDRYADILLEFFERIESSTIVWVNQAQPKGFGDAVLQTERLVGNEAFLVYAGDTYVISPKRDVNQRLISAYNAGGADATFLIQEVPNPKEYGVAEVEEGNGDRMRVRRVVEKPINPPSRFAIMPIYIFNPVIFKALRVTKPGMGGELQLTDAIQELIDTGHEVEAVKLHEDDIRLDIGTPEAYWDALSQTHAYASHFFSPS